MPRIKQNKDIYDYHAFAKAVRKGGVDKGLNSMLQIAEFSGIPYRTMLHRLEHPETLKAPEIRILFEKLKLGREAAEALLGVKIE